MEYPTDEAPRRIDPYQSVAVAVAMRGEYWPPMTTEEVKSCMDSPDPFAREREILLQRGSR